MAHAIRRQSVIESVLVSMCSPFISCLHYGYLVPLTVRVVEGKSDVRFLVIPDADKSFVCRSDSRTSFRSSYERELRLPRFAGFA